MPMNAEALARACERKFIDLVLDEVERDGSFSGYASLFGRVDLGKDVVEKGAFARSLGKRGAGGIRMLFQHDPSEPIGTWTEIREDERGLFVRGRLAKGVTRAGEVLSLMRSGALDGLSIGFKALRTRREPASGVRRILEADLWEISVVTFPMLPGARIETVKGRRPRRAGPAPGSAQALVARIREVTRIINKRGKTI
jgi:HK97 family phage prohead protease